jgi:galactonate dehydratase
VGRQAWETNVKIARVETIALDVTRRGGWLFVALHTDDGRVGFGEASQSGEEAATDALIRDVLAPRLLGVDPRRAAGLSDELIALARPRPNGGPGATALSAVDQALWDLRAQAYGVPLHELLGGAVRPSVPLYANVNRGVWERTPAGFAAQARAAVAAGFRAVKCAPFDGVTPAGLAESGAWRTVEEGVARVAAVREAIGPGVELMVDCHSRFTLETALRVADALAPLDLLWLEEPLAWSADADGLRAVRAKVPMPTAAAEHAHGLATYWPLVRDPIADVLMPDVKYCGGPWVLQQIGALTAAAGLGVSPHNPSGPISTLASAQVAATLPNLRRLEYPFGEVDWRDELLGGGESIVDGELHLPTAPGLGAMLSDDFLAARGAVRRTVGA